MQAVHNSETLNPKPMIQRAPRAPATTNSWVCLSRRWQISVNFRPGFTKDCTYLCRVWGLGFRVQGSAAPGSSNFKEKLHSQLGHNTHPPSESHNIRKYKVPLFYQQLAFTISIECMDVYKLTKKLYMLNPESSASHQTPPPDTGNKSYFLALGTHRQQIVLLSTWVLVRAPNTGNKSYFLALGY